ncbi:glycosyltransferase family 24 protein [Tilletiaria anomala UBC 951]|uniref:Glycosyltransferase family 24 protein n=1 Tax=Tilletiaria anomala (strain ATCC 24038 / CBS 436.72 / UBC 951) TaxID=1037660 RepID=A0A066VSA0_TILAU|nr:glycosyltransferase family 24 protein [Tilletiaria anomala UBC 951]KDN41684.1 glycosyltransferase family 24 protein [Tilletiaria anomala UBC 951]
MMLWIRSLQRLLPGLLLVALVPSVLCSGSDLTGTPSIRVDLRAPWSAPPPLLEILEAVNSLDSTAFFDAVTQLTVSGIAQNTSAKKASYKEIYETSLEVLQKQGIFKAPGAREILDLSLALHSESPQVEAFWHLYRTTGVEKLYREQVVGEEAQQACRSWALVQGKVICSAPALDEALAAGSPTNQEGMIEVPFDHSLSPTSASSLVPMPTVVLYADLSSPNFAELHGSLYRHAVGKSSLPLRYILRWRPSEEDQRETVYLSGYGAALDLKKVDYLVIDDRKLRDDANVTVTGAAAAAAAADTVASYEQLSAESALSDRRWLQAQIGGKKGSTGAEDIGAKISEENTLKLGYKAAQVIAASSDPLRALRELSQNFPFHAKQLSGVKLKKNFLDEITHNQDVRVEAGSNDVWLNGKSIPHKDVTPLGFLKKMRSESILVHSLTDRSRGVGLSPKAAVDLLSNSTLGKAFIGSASEPIAVDASDRIERGLRMLSGALVNGASTSKPSAITWWNDLEKDDVFAHWPRDFKTLLQPLWPGQFPQIARNVFHVVLALDLSRKESCRFLAESVFPASTRIGLRWGLVPIWGSGDGQTIALTRMFYHIFDSLGPDGSARYLRRVGLSGVPESTTINLEEAKKEFAAALGTVASQNEIQEILKRIDPSDSDFMQDRLNTAVSYAQRVGAKLSKGRLGHAFVNGYHVPFDNGISQSIGQQVQAQLQALAPLIYYNTLSTDADLSNHFYDQEDTLTYRSPLLSADGASNLTTRMINLATLEPELLNEGPLSRYFAARPDSVNVTMYIAGDFDSAGGQEMLAASLGALEAGSFRLGLLHQPSSAQGNRTVSTALYTLLNSHEGTKLQPSSILSVLPARPELTPGEVSEENVAKVHALLAAEDSDAAKRAHDWWGRASPMLEALGCGAKSICLVANGRVLSGFRAADVIPADIQAVAQLEGSKRARKVQASLIELAGRPSGASQDSHRVALAASALAADYAPDEAAEGLFRTPPALRLSAFDRIDIMHSGFEIGNRDKASFRYTAIIDPLTETAQRWSSILEMASQWPNTYIKVILNPTPKLREVPLRQFYRYRAPGKVTFEEDGSIRRDSILFTGMPEDAVLTLGLDTPSVWLAMAEDAVYDLDNIRLSSLPSASRSSGVSATYELKRILIEGHARDGQLNSIPRGLQLLLDTADGQERLDTIVMENLAYFQFRAKPGLWHLKLREGKSNGLYEMLSVGNLGWNSPNVNVTGNVVTLASLEGLTIYPQVRKRPGMEDEQLLEDIDKGPEAQDRAGSRVADAAKSLLGSVFSKIASSTPSLTKPQSPHADINIFTVASGHLYERMTYIMILSVLRNTQHSVKFWFIENFLSPSFKEFIPHLAKEYGFAYELISYAWPHWLRSQKEKQRVIWGNKILFLDVLFPLDLDKVIFVDADQIVRTDMIDLVNVNLEGAPYGYPPMGDDSEDMEGFRFWKQGYWKQFLRGRPYHISALYVVDLVRFRQIAAGDRLRGQYQALSADPNSLANLDQDLPNNLQFSLPIHTLDKEWLWCETWCSYEWLDRAKTIDLCSNPKTKEPKLDRARRQIPEWTKYDDEISAFAARLSDEKRIGTNVVSSKESEQVPSAVQEGGASALILQGGDEPAQNQDALHVDTLKHKHDEL